MVVRNLSVYLECFLGILLNDWGYIKIDFELGC